MKFDSHTTSVLYYKYTQGKWSCNSDTFPRVSYPAKLFYRRNNMVGIYQIVNIVDGKRYVGQSVNISKRKYEHFLKLKRNVHGNRYLQRAYNKYGVSSFKFVVLLYCSKDDLTLYEQMCVDGLNPEYNICKECVDSCRGVHPTEETRNKMSESRKGKSFSEETRNKMSESNRRREYHPASEETRRKMSESQKKRFQISPVSNETRNKMSSNWKSGQKIKRKKQEKCEKKVAPIKLNKRNLTEETIKKMSESAKKRGISEETREKMYKDRRYAKIMMELRRLGN